MVKANFVISIIAILIPAAISIYLFWHKNKKEKTENNKAMIRGSLSFKNFCHMKLDIYNYGKADAKNISFEVIGEHTTLFAKVNEPIKKISPQGTYRVLLDRPKSPIKEIEIKFTWDDNNKTDNEYTQVLQL